MYKVPHLGVEDLCQVGFRDGAEGEAHQLRQVPLRREDAPHLHNVRMKGTWEPHHRLFAAAAGAWKLNFTLKGQLGKCLPAYILRTDCPLRLD